MIRIRTGNRHKIKHLKRCLIAALFVLSALLFGLPALADDENAPKVTDWGIFDDATGAMTSLGGTGVIEGSAVNGSFYIRFDHNVAERSSVNVADVNCALISVRSTDGRAVPAAAWVKDTQLEFQYRQCIFVTISGAVDPSKNYRIVIAPGITAKNGSVNSSGASLYFSFSDPGSGGDDPLNPGGDDPSDPGGDEPSKEEPEKKPKKKKKKKKKKKETKKEEKDPSAGQTPSGGRSGTGSSGTRTGTGGYGSRTGAGIASGHSSVYRYGSGARNAQDRDSAARTTAKSQEQKETLKVPSYARADENVKAYRLTPETAGRFAALLSRAPEEEETSPEVNKVASLSDDGPVILLSILVCLGLILAGGAAEAVVFKKRL